MHILPGFHRGAVQARNLLPQPRALLQRGTQLIFVGKKKKGKDKDGFELRSEIKKPQKI